MAKISREGKKFGEIARAPVVKLKRGCNKPTAKAYLQVFGNGAADTGLSVYLFADSQRYVFNCGEATQRLFNENKLKLGKINNLFLTQLTWQFIGGLPGLLLTLREASKQSLNIHGPIGLLNLINESQCFLSMNNVDLECSEYGSKTDKVYQDENIIVKAISCKGEEENFSYNSQITEISDDKNDCLNNEECLHYESNVDLNSGKSKLQHCVDKSRKRLKLDVKSKTVVSYVCELVAMPGKMNIKKALELGVPNGPLLGKLQKGQDVTLENGSVVKAEDIMEKSSGGSVFCIIDCPSQHYFKQLQENLASHEELGENTTPVIIVHLTPVQIVQTREYQNWTERFGACCQHLFLNSSTCPPKVAMFSQLGIQYSLNQLNPRIFPRLFASDEPENESYVSHKQNWTAGEPYLIFHLRPRPSSQKCYDQTEIASKWEVLAEKVMERQRYSKPTEITVNGMRDSLKEFVEPEKFMCSKDTSYESVENSKDTLTSELKDMDEEFRMVFLGTGASLPSKYRNVSCTLVNISKDKLMLLDCGEGTYGQLYRHYGPNLDDVLRKLCCIFISHIHADHHLGLVRVLHSWEESTRHLPVKDKQDPVLIIGPPSLLLWLKYYGNFCETLHLRFYDSSKFQADPTAENETLSSLLESKVAIVPVVHCPNAFGLVMTHKKGWKLVYSGDTRPCSGLVDAGQNATVLIHEATLEDNLQTEASAKQHSTTSEAIQCGQKMQAKFTLLNHFSQRYPKIPVFNEEFNDCVGIAFDHMSVTFRDLCYLPKLLQPLQEIFKGEIEEQRERSESSTGTVETNTV